MNLEPFLKRENTVAVVGASRNPKKWGYRLYRFFKRYYRKVYPVNPRAEEIDDDKAYPDLRSLPEKPDLVNLVVPPTVAREVVRDAIRMGIKMIWFQPGSEDEEVIRECLKAGINVIWGKCLMEETINYSSYE